MSVMVRYSPELCHYGIKGQKWGIRRYQNSDGSLTPEGIKRYGDNPNRKVLRTMRKEAKKEYRQDQESSDRVQLVTSYVGGMRDRSRKVLDKTSKKYDKISARTDPRHMRKLNKAAMNYSVAKALNEEFEQEYAKWDSLNKANYDSLIKKYGNDAVTKFDKGENSLIKRSKNGTFVAGDALARNTRVMAIPIGEFVYFQISYPAANYDDGILEYNKQYRKARKAAKKNLRR